MRNGSCFCGNIAFAAQGEPNRVLNCHCQSCRHHTGAPMATLAVYHPDQVTFTGTPRKLFASAPGVSRAFCPDCGTTITWETTLGDEPICAIHISTFADPAGLPPVGHSFYGERIDWFDALDDLPRFSGFVTGATPVQVGPTRITRDDP